MAFKKIFKGLPSDFHSADGLLEMDWKALTACQRECTTRLGVTTQLEQEAYLTQHPEIRAALEVFIAKMVRCAKHRVILQAAAEHFTQPFSDLDRQVRKRLGVPMDGPYMKDDKQAFYFEDENLEKDLKDIITKHYPPDPCHITPSPIETPNTLSSSFISIITSGTTQPTPEPVKTPSPTTSELMFKIVSNSVDKAVYSRVNDADVVYDTAYVELMKAVEEAMEIPVKEIREDIAELLFDADRMFEINIIEKERIAAECAWEKRMRKKLKRTLRRQKNFKGYETPPTPKSEISSHESYKKPPQRPCPCTLPFHFNRYPKDRFGIYLPRVTDYSKESVTATPAFAEEQVDPEPGASSAHSTGSTYSRKSTLSKKKSNKS